MLIAFDSLYILLKCVWVGNFKEISFTENKNTNLLQNSTWRIMLWAALECLGWIAVLCPWVRRLSHLRWFPSFVLRIPIAHDVCVISARKWARAQNVRDFPQTKPDSEINARFLLNEHGDPHFLFYKFNENNTLNNWEKNWQKSMATFLANEINATDRDVTIPTKKVQIMFPLKDKNVN